MENIIQNNQKASKNHSQSNSPQKQSQGYVSYKFIFQKLASFGQAVHLIGNIKQLGKWNIDCAIRLQCYSRIYWMAQILIPINVQIQYKFFISAYEHHPQKKLNKYQILQWIGDSQGSNLVLFIYSKLAQYHQDKNKTKQLKIMSFNLRFDSKSDKKQCSWQNRKQNCLNVIKQFRPSIFGVQQPLKHQRTYLQNELAQDYTYYGVARDCYQGEQVGVFVDHQRFIVVQYGFQWISQTKKAGSIGYGARLPRYFTYLIVQDLYTSKAANSLFNHQKTAQKQKRSLLMIVNIHLDHESELSQKKGIQQIVQKIQVKSKQYCSQQLGIIEDYFLVGDFNCEQQNSIFQIFRYSVVKMTSIRKEMQKLGYKNCDTRGTFHGFSGNFIMKIFDAITMNSYTTIDHLFINTKNFRPTAFSVLDKFTVKDQKKPILSDHHPIIGNFQFISKNQQKIGNK